MEIILASGSQSMISVLWFPGSPTSALPALIAMRMYFSDLQKQEHDWTTALATTLKFVYPIAAKAAFRRLLPAYD